ncbi:MAG: tRNA (N6-isopentenyl adenosine(37)-C2)-methylthiotransferase MiaB [Thermomicrobiales bacterium]|nr:tRNA (N6-isopentenyl adenosine(37)-C2)-methylthiotransferase MiaB [Thermomicrobiales bacterium]
MNEADSSRVAAMLMEAGYRATDSEATADIVILNSCVVRQAAEDKVAGRLNALIREKRQRPDMSLVLTGCMVTNQQEKLAQRFPHVDLFFDPSDFDTFKAFVPELSDLEDDLETLPHYYVDTATDARVSAYVPIIYGCNFLCSYCIVPYRRGKERSRPMAEIVSEVEHLVQRGVRDVTLLGQTVNAWGHDLDGDAGLADLLRAVDGVEGLERLRFLTSHPKYMGDDILEAMADLPTACEHLNLPVQAGNNDVLKRMRRTYTVDLWVDRIQKARELMPGLTVATDIIVGFPGETDEQFDDTLTVLREAELDKVHVAMYSPRPGTLSARWEDDVPADVKHARHTAVEQQQHDISERLNQKRLGESVEVLFDSFNKGRWGGRSRGNTLVHVEDSRPLLGKMADIRITETTPWYVMGSVVGDPR